METTTILSNIKKSFNYNEYKNLVIRCSEGNSTTGNEQIKERIEATMINAQRMKRIDKQVILNSEIQGKIGKINKKWTWVLLAESWCGDGAQNIPVIGKIAESSAKIELKIILRDENPEIMDGYLTNGSRSIPKLICINSETMEEIGVWGPRSAKIQQMVKEYKSQNPTVSHDEFVKNLHLWYAQDKGESLQKEFEWLITQWSFK